MATTCYAIQCMKQQRWQHWNWPVVVSCVWFSFSFCPSDASYTARCTSSTKPMQVLRSLQCTPCFRTLIGHMAMQQTRTMLQSLQSLNTSVDRIKVHSICIPICIDTMPVKCASGVDTRTTNKCLQHRSTRTTQGLSRVHSRWWLHRTQVLLHACFT